MQVDDAVLGAPAQQLGEGDERVDEGRRAGRDGEVRPQVRDRREQQDGRGTGSRQREQQPGPSGAGGAGRAESARLAGGRRSGTARAGHGSSSSRAAARWGRRAGRRCGLAGRASRSCQYLSRLASSTDADCAGAEDAHDDREADHDLGGGDHHDEERDDLAVEGAVDPAEGHEGQVDGVEHQLDAHEDQDRVAPQQHADRADAEQQRGEEQVVGRRSWPAPSGSPIVGCVGAAARATLSERRGCRRAAAPASATQLRWRRRRGRAAGTGGRGEPARGPSPAGSARSGRRSLCASTIAPSAAVMSSALVTSKAKT